jgi:hypothetical protein
MGSVTPRAACNSFDSIRLDFCLEFGSEPLAVLRRGVLQDSPLYKDWQAICEAADARNRSKFSSSMLCRLA